MNISDAFPDDSTAISISSPAVRVVQVNLAADPALVDPEQLLQAYHTLTGWSDALSLAGAEVRVIQRFARDVIINHGDAVYAFVHDGEPGMPEPWAVFPRVTAAIGHAGPDIVHVNGLMFPGMVREARRTIGGSRVLVLQDHSGGLPRRSWWRSRRHWAAAWTEAFDAADACMFTDRALARPWSDLGLRPDMLILEIPEASTQLAPIERETARTRTGVSGAPAILWVGRLDRNKDPLTVLAAIEQATRDLPALRLSMVVPGGAPGRHGYTREEIASRIAASDALRGRVVLTGPITHADMAAYYSAADILVSGSHHEGSGYALIEAMACGVTPCVTDIPAFRALTGGCGALWRVGDAHACTAALRDLGTRDWLAERKTIRDRFEQAISWAVVGRRAVDAYAALLARKRRPSS